MTPTDRLSGFGTGLATNSDSGERVPRGHCSQYSISTVLHAHLFSVAWLLSSRGVGDRDVRLTGSTTARCIFELKLAEVPSGPA
jgi:hypothetical protein